MSSPAQLVRLRLEQGVHDVIVDPPHREALVIVLAGSRAVGQIRLAGPGLHPAAEVRPALSEQLGERLARLEIAREARLALRGSADGPPDPDVSVVVCTRSRPELLARCLDSLAAVTVKPAEFIVVDNAPDDRRTLEVCEPRPVRYIAAGGLSLPALRNLGADEARSELVAFVDDDCIVEPGWLDGLGEPFADVLCSAVVGYVGPLELADVAQYWFEAHGGFEMSFERRVIDGAYSAPALAASPLGVGNVVFRRAALQLVGGFDARMGPGTSTRAKEDAALFVKLLLAGTRVIFDPARVVWHRHRRSRRDLRRVLHDYACGDSAYTALCLLEHRQFDALKLWRWWWRTHLPSDLRRLLNGDPGAVPLDCIVAEAAGTVRGAAGFLRARRRPTPARPRVPSPAPPPVARVVKGMPPASVVVPSHDRRDRLLEVLGGLAGQTARATMEVVLVLDGCRDGSAGAVRSVQWPFALKVVEQPAAGVAAARNRGAAEAAHDLLVFLDDDLVPAAGLVAAHAEAADGATVTMGRHPPPPPDDALAAVLCGWWEDHFRRKGQPGRPWSFLDLCSGNSAMPRTVLLGAGGFDERFTSRGEDFELGVRLLERGVMFRYLPAAIGEHRIDTDLAATVAKTRAEGRNDVMIARRHPHVFDRLRLARERGAALDLALADPRAAERALAVEVRKARAWEKVGLRGRWGRALGEVSRLAFALGARAELGDAAALGELAAASGGAAPARLSLDAGGGLAPLPSTGTSSVEVWRQGERLTEVCAVDGGEQWDNDVVVERVAAAVASVAGRDVVAEVLGR